MTALLFLLAFAQATPLASGRVPDLRIVGSLDGAPPVARPTFHLRQGERLVLSIEAADGSEAGPGISWFLFKPVLKEYSNLWKADDPEAGNVHLEPIRYVGIPIRGLNGRPEIDISLIAPADDPGTYYIGAAALKPSEATTLRLTVLTEASPLHLKYRQRIVQVTRRVDDSYLGRLSELFQTPFIIAPRVTEPRVHETDERMGSDCASFAIYGMRRQGFRIPYCGPLGIYRFLTEIGGSPAWPGKSGSPGVYLFENGEQVPVGPGKLEPGDIVHFGEQVSVFYADAGRPGVLDKDDLLIQCYLGGPTITSIKDSGFFHRPVRIFKWRNDIVRSPGTTAQ
jgi:hypothetical protein